jgi:hypothetical protein
MRFASTPARVRATSATRGDDVSAVATLQAIVVRDLKRSFRQKRAASSRRGR